jgi:hypothetical protein
MTQTVPKFNYFIQFLSKNLVLDQNIYWPCYVINYTLTLFFGEWGLWSYTSSLNTVNIVYWKVKIKCLLQVLKYNNRIKFNFFIETLLSNELMFSEFTYTRNTLKKMFCFFRKRIRSKKHSFIIKIEFFN